MSIRVRFAPSPTGYLHIGGVRTALFNFLYARSQKGTFLVRIEDTDRERFDPAFEKEILDSMEWLGLSSDELIVRQSERLDRYRELARELVLKDLAYEEEKDGKKAIRFRIPEGEKTQVFFYDVIREKVSFDASLFDDLVILKSDGYPTYHFACVVDDHDMEVSHVIRGEDHLSNTPRQILLYSAFGWKPPKYAHLPLILGDDGTPLSKRHGAVALSSFKAEGYLPQALLNYLAMLGWGSSSNQEFFQVDDLIKKFSLKKVNKAAAKFNPEKLEWLNGEHLKALPEDVYIFELKRAIGEKANKFSEDIWKKLALLYRTRIKRYSDLMTQAWYCFDEVKSYKEDVLKSFSSQENLEEHLAAWIDKCEALSFSDDAEVEKMTRDLADARGLKAKDYVHPLRFAISGETVTPGLFEVMVILGKETCIRRIRQFIQAIASV